jgi:hypothetical protein
MNRLVNIFLLTIALLFIKRSAIAQSVEVYAGHKRVGVDVLWFKNFRTKQEERIPVLFFSRNRASVDYNKDSPTAFGSTNAISYNFKNGLGIVAVAAFSNTGFTPKMGAQYFKQKNDFMFFGWIVSDVKDKGGMDLFGLFRYQPKINEKWRVFSQLELFPVYNFYSETWSLTQRLRLGTKHHTWAVGFAADFNQTGENLMTTSHNLGVFLRNDF